MRYLIFKERVAKAQKPIIFRYAFAIVLFLVCLYIIFYVEQKSIIYNLSLGMVVSFIFYSVVLYIPSYLRRKIIKENLKNDFIEFKRTVIDHLISVLKESVSMDKIDTLLNPKNYSKFFKSKVESSKHDSRWCAIHNEAEDATLIDIQEEIKLFSQKLIFYIQNLNTKNEEIFSLFMGLYEELNRLINLDFKAFPYENRKSFLNRLWQMFSDYDFSEGKKDYDLLLLAIEKS